MSPYEALQAPPWSVVYFSIPIVVWAFCFAYCHFTFDPARAPDAPTPWYERLAFKHGFVFVFGGLTALALLRDSILPLFD